MSRFGFPLIVATLLLSGCGRSSPNNSSNTTEAPPSVTTGATGFPITVTDALNRRVTLEKPPARIISLAPRNTEILFAIGAGDRVIGVTSYCNYPSEAAKREQVGGFSGPTVNLEKIVRLEPDLILTAGNLHEPLVDRLEDLDLQVVALYAESFEEMFRELELAGRITGRDKEAQSLAADLKRRIDAVHKKAKSIPEKDRRRVMYLVSDEPLMAAGPSSFIGKLIENCGGENVFHDVDQAYPQISEEAVLARDPEVLLIPSSFDSEEFRRHLFGRPAWSDLKALRDKRVVFLNEDLLSRCGPRSAHAQEAMAKAIYPDYFVEKP